MPTAKNAFPPAQSPEPMEDGAEAVKKVAFMAARSFLRCFFDSLAELFSKLRLFHARSKEQARNCRA